MICQPVTPERQVSQVDHPVPGHELHHLQSSVEGAVVDRLEGDVGPPGVEMLAAGRSGDHREDNHPEPVHQSGGQQRPAQTEAADGAQGGVAVPLHSADQ